MKFEMETELEVDGRWIAEIPAIPGAMVYADTQAKAIANVQALALKVISDRIRHGEA